MHIRSRLYLAIASSLLVFGLLAAGTALAQSQSPQEKQRGDLLREIGLKKKPSQPAAQPPDGGTSAAADDGAAGEPPAKSASPGRRAPTEKPEASKGSGAAPAAPSFRRAIHPILTASCKPCHSPGAAAAASHLLFSGDAAADHRAVARFVDTRNPGASVLLAKVSGAAPHGGGALWPTTGAPYERMLAWIRGGARLDGAAAPEPVEAPATPPIAARRRALPSHDAGGPAGAAVESSLPVAAEAAPVATPVPPAAVALPVATPPVSNAPGPSPPPPTFAASVHPILMGACAACHAPTRPAAMTRLVLSGDAVRDEVIARALVDEKAPERSLLVTKASGEMHGGGVALPPGDPRLGAILAWVQGLATKATGAPTAGAGVAAAPSPSSAAPESAPARDPRGAVAGDPGHPGSGGGHGAPGGLALPLGFMINGRFDLDYERRQFSGNPFASSSVAALRSYHHFLFLSRDVADDPCGLSAEILTLQFWEAHCRVGRLPAPFRLTVAGGKIVVPFGADPLYHQNYGGLGGFDQRILPVIWAVEGVAAHLVVDLGELALTDDFYVVRGYALQHADSVLNLQNDFSAVDQAKLGWGNRVGAAWMFASVWYSGYLNPLGFGRRLFMQALDLTVWRPRNIPVLGHFSLGAGLLRADVSGGGAGVGGPGLDYYDFGSYFQLRYHPTDWLYIQYREGLRTFNNRRGVILDSSRLTNSDGSSHNFGVVARHRGLTVGLFYFINLEKVDEIPDDLLRLMVVYEF